MKILVLLSTFLLMSLCFGQMTATEYQTKAYSLLQLKPTKDNLNAINDLAFTGKYIDYELTDSIASYVLSNSDKKGFESINAFANKLKGIMADEKGQYEKSIQFYLKAIDQYSSLNKALDVGKCEANIGIILRKQKQLEASNRYFRNCLKTFKEENFAYGVQLIETNIGLNFTEMNDVDSSLFYLNRAEKSMNELKSIDPNVYGNLGNTYLMKGELETALEYFEKCISVFEKHEINNKNSAVWYFSYARALRKNGDLKKAVKYIAKSKEITGDNQYTRESFSLYINDADLQYELKNYKEAALSYRMVNNINDSIYRIDKAQLTQDLAEKYQAEKKELEIENLNKEKKIEEEKRKSEEQKVLYLTIGSILLVLIIIYSIISIYIKIKDNKRIQAKNRLIQKQKEIVEEKNKEILDSIQYAKRLQDAILPTRKLVKSYFVESFVLYEPKDIVSGDFYWMEAKDGLTMFAAADCTGHGVPGAMVSVVCANALNKAVNELSLTDPGSILNATRDIVVETYTKTGADVQDGMDISICVYNLDRKELLWAGANNPLWIIRKDQPEVDVIKADKQPIGKFGKSVPFTTHKVNINEGDTIYLFSDGFADQFGGEYGKKMKPVKFKELLIENQQKNLDQQKKELFKAFKQWKGDLDQIDDVCVIGVRF
jgi:serine phosphatase RsbU (regulator of sigma subunit)